MGEVLRGFPQWSGLTGAWLAVAVFALSGLALAETTPPESVLEPLEKQRLGTKLYNQRRSLVLANDTLVFATVTDMVHGAGQGHNLLLWQRAIDREVWRLRPIRPERKPTMISVAPLEGRADEMLVSYVDREDEDAREVYLERVREGEPPEELLSYSDNRGVLNPICVPVPEQNLAYLFIPDRGADWRIRWFRIGLTDGSVERLEDIPMPEQGARLFDHHREGDRLILPVGLSEELHVLEIDLASKTHELTKIDEASSPDGQPCREIDIHWFPEQNLFLLTYLRPTEFSDRPRTGLQGEVVANAIDDETLEPRQRTVIGGYSAEEAATHQIASAKVADDAFVAAYTTVDEIHQRHLTGEFVNYVGSHIDRWHLAPDGHVTPQVQHELPPFWRVDMVFDDEQGILYVILGDTEEVFPLWLQRWRVR